MAAFSICIQNLGMYNEGTLLFKWLELPCSDDEINEALDYIKVCHDDVMYYGECGNPYEELMIADWECDFDGLVGEWSNIWELNEIAEQIDDLTSHERDMLEALMDRYKLEEALEKLDDCYYWQDCDTLTDLAYAVVEAYGYLDEASDVIRDFFDYEAYGRHLDMVGEFIPCGTGYLEVI